MKYFKFKMNTCLRIQLHPNRLQANNKVLDQLLKEVISNINDIIYIGGKKIAQFLSSQFKVVISTLKLDDRSVIYYTFWRDSNGFICQYSSVLLRFERRILQMSHIWRWSDDDLSTFYHHWLHIKLHFNYNMLVIISTLKSVVVTLIICRFV